MYETVERYAEHVEVEDSFNDKKCGMSGIYSDFINEHQSDDQNWNLLVLNSVNIQIL